LTAFVAPIEELESFGRRNCVLRNRLHQYERRARDRPRLVAGRVRHDHVEVLGAGPIGTCGGSLEGLHCRSDGLARMINHLGIGQVVLLGVSVFDIAERALGLSRIVGNTLAALGADADGPFDCGVLADLFFPFGLTLER